MAIACFIVLFLPICFCAVTPTPTSLEYPVVSYVTSATNVDVSGTTLTLLNTSYIAPFASLAADATARPYPAPALYAGGEYVALFTFSSRALSPLLASSGDSIGMFVISSSVFETPPRCAAVCSALGSASVSSVVQTAAFTAIRDAAGSDVLALAAPGSAGGSPVYVASHLPSLDSGHHRICGVALSAGAVNPTESDYCAAIDLAGPHASARGFAAATAVPSGLVAVPTKRLHVSHAATLSFASVAYAAVGITASDEGALVYSITDWDSTSSSWGEGNSWIISGANATGSQCSYALRYNTSSWVAAAGAIEFVDAYSAKFSLTVPTDSVGTTLVACYYARATVSAGLGSVAFPLLNQLLPIYAAVPSNVTLMTTATLRPLSPVVLRVETPTGLASLLTVDSDVVKAVVQGSGCSSAAVATAKLAVGNLITLTFPAAGSYELCYRLFSAGSGVSQTLIAGAPAVLVLPPTPTNSPIPTPTPSTSLPRTASHSPTPSRLFTPSGTTTATLSPLATISETTSRSVSRSLSSTPSPRATPSASPTPTPNRSLSPSSSQSATRTPSLTYSAPPTPSPSATPSPSPSNADIYSWAVEPPSLEPHCRSIKFSPAMAPQLCSFSLAPRTVRSFPLAPLAYTTVPARSGNGTESMLSFVVISRQIAIIRLELDMRQLSSAKIFLAPINMSCSVDSLAIVNDGATIQVLTSAPAVIRVIDATRADVLLAFNVSEGTYDLCVLPPWSPAALLTAFRAVIHVVANATTAPTSVTASTWNSTFTAGGSMPRLYPHSFGSPMTAFASENDFVASGDVAAALGFPAGTQLSQTGSAPIMPSAGVFFANYGEAYSSDAIFHSSVETDGLCGLSASFLSYDNAAFVLGTPSDTPVPTATPVTSSASVAVATACLPVPLRSIPFALYDTEEFAVRMLQLTSSEADVAFDNITSGPTGLLGLHADGDVGFISGGQRYNASIYTVPTGTSLSAGVVHSCSVSMNGSVLLQHDVQRMRRLAVSWKVEGVDVIDFPIAFTHRPSDPALPRAMPSVVVGVPQRLTLQVPGNTALVVFVASPTRRCTLPGYPSGTTALSFGSVRTGVLAADSGTSTGKFMQLSDVGSLEDGTGSIASLAAVYNNNSGAVRFRLTFTPRAVGPLILCAAPVASSSAWASDFQTEAAAYVERLTTQATTFASVYGTLVFTNSSTGASLIGSPFVNVWMNASAQVALSTLVGLRKGDSLYRAGDWDVLGALSRPSCTLSLDSWSEAVNSGASRRTSVPLNVFSAALWVTNPTTTSSASSTVSPTSLTVDPTASVSPTPTLNSTASATVTATNTTSDTYSESVSESPTVSPTYTMTPLPTPTSTPTRSRSVTATHIVTPSRTETPSLTQTPSTFDSKANFSFLSTSLTPPLNASVAHASITFTLQDAYVLPFVDLNQQRTRMVWPAVVAALLVNATWSGISRTPPGVTCDISSLDKAVSLTLLRCVMKINTTDPVSMSPKVTLDIIGNRDAITFSLLMLGRSAGSNLLGSISVAASGLHVIASNEALHQRGLLPTSFLPPVSELHPASNVLFFTSPIPRISWDVIIDESATPLPLTPGDLVPITLLLKPTTTSPLARLPAEGIDYVLSLPSNAGCNLTGQCSSAGPSQGVFVTTPNQCSKENATTLLCKLASSGPLTSGFMVSVNVRLNTAVAAAANLFSVEFLRSDSATTVAFGAAALTTPSANVSTLSIPVALSAADISLAIALQRKPSNTPTDAALQYAILQSGHPTAGTYVVSGSQVAASIDITVTQLSSSGSVTADVLLSLLAPTELEVNVALGDLPAGCLLSNRTVGAMPFSFTPQDYPLEEGLLALGPHTFFNVTTLVDIVRPVVVVCRLTSILPTSAQKVSIPFSVQWRAGSSPPETSAIVVLAASLPVHQNETFLSNNWLQFSTRNSPTDSLQQGTLRVLSSGSPPGVTMTSFQTGRSMEVALSPISSSVSLLRVSSTLCNGADTVGFGRLVRIANSASLGGKVYVNTKSLYADVIRGTFVVKAALLDATGGVVSCGSGIVSPLAANEVVAPGSVVSPGVLSLSVPSGNQELSLSVTVHAIASTGYIPASSGAPAPFSSHQARVGDALQRLRSLTGVGMPSWGVDGNVSDSVAIFESVAALGDLRLVIFDHTFASSAFPASASTSVLQAWVIALVASIAFCLLLLILLVVLYFCCWHTVIERRNSKVGPTDPIMNLHHGVNAVGLGDDELKEVTPNIPIPPGLVIQNIALPASPYKLATALPRRGAETLLYLKLHGAELFAANLSHGYDKVLSRIMTVLVLRCAGFGGGRLLLFNGDSFICAFPHQAGAIAASLVAHTVLLNITLPPELTVGGTKPFADVVETRDWELEGQSGPFGPVTPSVVLYHGPRASIVLAEAPQGVCIPHSAASPPFKYTADQFLELSTLFDLVQPGQTLAPAAVVLKAFPTIPYRAITEECHAVLADVRKLHSHYGNLCTCKSEDVIIAATVLSAFDAAVAAGVGRVRPIMVSENVPTSPGGITTFPWCLVQLGSNHKEATPVLAMYPRYLAGRYLQHVAAKPQAHVHSGGCCVGLASQLSYLAAQPLLSPIDGVRKYCESATLPPTSRIQLPEKAQVQLSLPPRLQLLAASGENELGATAIEVEDDSAAKQPYEAFHREESMLPPSTAAPFVPLMYPNMMPSFVPAPKRMKRKKSKKKKSKRKRSGSKKASSTRKKERRHPGSDHDDGEKIHLPVSLSIPLGDGKSQFVVSIPATRHVGGPAPLSRKSPHRRRDESSSSSSESDREMPFREGRLSAPYTDLSNSPAAQLIANRVSRISARLEAIKDRGSVGVDDAEIVALRHRLEALNGAFIPPGSAPPLRTLPAMPVLASPMSSAPGQIAEAPLLPVPIIPAVPAKAPSTETLEDSTPEPVVVAADPAVVEKAINGVIRAIDSAPPPVPRHLLCSVILLEARHHICVGQRLGPEDDHLVAAVSAEAPDVEELELRSLMHLFQSSMKDFKDAPDLLAELRRFVRVHVVEVEVEDA